MPGHPRFGREHAAGKALHESARPTDGRLNLSMPTQHQPTSHLVRSERKRPTSKKESKRPVLNKSRSATVASIAHALVIKDEDLFFLCAPDGMVPLGGRHGLGLYYHDCRFLNGYELHLSGRAADSLVASAQLGYKAVLELSNPSIDRADGNIPKESVGVYWERVIDAPANALRDRLTFSNYTLDSLHFSAQLRFSAAFEDVFKVRGMKPGRTGRKHPPAWQGKRLEFVYDGADKIRRSVAVAFSRGPDRRLDSGGEFFLSLGPREEYQLEVRLLVKEKPEPYPGSTGTPAQDLTVVEAKLRESLEGWMRDQTSVDSDSQL